MGKIHRQVIEILPTGEEFIYDSIKECAEKLGINHNTLDTWIKGTRRNTVNKNKYKYGDLVEVSCKGQPIKKTTLCWDCQNALCKCSWSREFKPVEGWTAIQTTIGRDRVKSFCVIECPEFREDKQ